MSRGARRDRGQTLAGRRLPTHREVVGHVTHGRAGDPGGHVVPAGGPSRRMFLPIPAVAVETGQVDATHECDSVVDDDRLLVMTVQRALARIERALDPGAGDELIANLPHVAAPGPEDRERRPRP